MRTLDLTTLRSFVAVADSGGVTRAAGFLHLTQSAVSMQLKRLEEALDIELLDRSGRTIALTASGEQLLVYARRMLALNDEAIARLTDQAFEGELSVGVPHDIVYPAIPRVLQQFNGAFPRVKVHLDSSHTRELKRRYGRGEVDMILTTETGIEHGGETLCVKPLIWIGAPGGSAWRQRPVRMAFGRQCTFRPRVVEALESAGIPWDVVVETESDRTIEATVAADLAVHALIKGTQPPHLEEVDHGGALPDLPDQRVNLYASPGGDVVQEAMAGFLRSAFAGVEAPRLQAV